MDIKTSGIGDLLGENRTTYEGLQALVAHSTFTLSPYGLKSFAKPDMASQNRRKKLRRISSI